MPDPLSISGLVLQIGAIVTQIYAYTQQVKDAKEEIRELLIELLALKAILEQLGIMQDSLPILSSPPVRDALTTTNGILIAVLADLEEKRTRRSHAIQKLTWPQTKSGTYTQVVRLERLKSYFSLVLMNDASALQREMITAIQQISISLDEDRIARRRVEESKRHRDIKDWIAPVNSISIHRRALAARHPGTGLWFLNEPFRKWFDPAQETNHILCVMGKSGCGKTTLCSTAVEEAQAITVDSDLHLAVYFYCSFDISLSHEPETILGSFLAQLSNHIPGILDDQHGQPGVDVQGQRPVGRGR